MRSISSSQAAIQKKIDAVEISKPLLVPAPGALIFSPFPAAGSGSGSETRLPQLFKHYWLCLTYTGYKNHNPTVHCTPIAIQIWRDIVRACLSKLEVWVLQQLLRADWPARPLLCAQVKYWTFPSPIQNSTCIFYSGRPVPSLKCSLSADSDSRLASCVYVILRTKFGFHFGNISSHPKKWKFEQGKYGPLLLNSF